MEVLSIELLLGLIAILVTIRYYLTKNYYYHWKKSKVSGPEPIILFGTFKNVPLNKIHIADYVNSVYDSYPDNTPAVGLFTNFTFTRGDQGESSLRKILPGKYNNKIMSADEQSMKSIIKDNVVMGKELGGKENMIFGRTILNSLRKYPDFVGMIDADTGNKTRFVEMKERSVRCALWLRKQGVGESDVVAVSTHIQMNDYVPVLATLFMNAIVSPWHYESTLANVQNFFKICRPKVIFACEESIDKFVEIAVSEGIDCQFVAFERHPRHISLEEIMAEQTQDEVNGFECTEPVEPRKKVSQILFSSGTTGTPKGIMLSYHSLLPRHVDESGVCSGMTCLWYSTFAWIAGNLLALASIRLRRTRIIHKEFDTEVTAAIIEKYKIDFIFWRPYLLTQCHQANVFTRYDFTHVKTITIGGTKMNRSILEECRKSLPRTFIRWAYGMTEAGGTVSRQTKNSKYIDSVGYPCSGTKLKVVDPNTGVVLGPNQEGEIYVKTDLAMLGYFNNPEETKKAMDEEGWLRSGDLGFYDKDGEVIIGDRLRTIVRTRFFTLSPFEFEETLIQHPDVNDCAVVGVQHPVDIERPFIFVVKAPNAKVTAEELIEFSASKNERYRLTGGLIFIDKLPCTPNGKKCLRKLQEMAKAHVKQ